MLLALQISLAFLFIATLLYLVMSFFIIDFVPWTLKVMVVALEKYEQSGKLQTVANAMFFICFFLGGYCSWILFKEYPF